MPVTLFSVGAVFGRQAMVEGVGPAIAELAERDILLASFGKWVAKLSVE